jgi:agmatine/peptidylarginine deiminase
MKHLLLFSLSLIVFSPSYSQQNLPKGFAPGEKEKMHSYLESRKDISTLSTNPPSLAVRTMAEWEEIQAITITWTSYTSVLRQIIKYAQDECKVIIVCSDSNSVKTSLTNNNIPITNIDFIKASYNSVWIRDYGANTVYANEVDSLSLVDWIYNRPRPYDDVIPQVVATYLDVPLYENTDAPYDLVHTGGNFMADGFGTAFSSNLVLEENDLGSTYTITTKDEAMVDSIMELYMGINRYIKMETLPYDGIHHIDMHMKLINEETLLIGEYPSGISDGPQIEANMQYVLSTFNSMFGTPYKIKRIVMPPDDNGKYPSSNGDYRTYTNSVIVNKTVLVPTYEEKYDTIALRIYRENMPGYNVVGIECNDVIQASGALHCITKEVGVNDPFLISHQALSDSYDTVTNFLVNAYINHRSGIANAIVYYSSDTANGFQSVAMVLADSINHTWTTNIPAANVSGKGFYYILATANSGKQQMRPITAPEGNWKFNIAGLTRVDESGSGAMAIQRVFPNPASAITCIEINNKIASQASLRLYDMLGNEIKVIHEGLMASGENRYFIDASKLARGAYFIILNAGSESKIEKLMVW